MSSIYSRSLVALGGAALAVLTGCSASTGNDTSSGAGSSGGTDSHFSFFVASFRAMQELSGSPSGFGGDLRFGEDGAGAGLRGADKICATIAEKSSPGAGKKQWRAFLSAVAGEDGKQVNAIDRVGEGPWYDRLGRLIANTKADLLVERPEGIDTAIKNDLPNEDGVPNHQPDPTQGEVDNHDTLTGTNDRGELYGATATCKDWTSAIGDRDAEGKPRVGHSWTRSGTMGGPGGMMHRPDGGPGDIPPPDGGIIHIFDGGPGGPGGSINGSPDNWMSTLDESGCAPGANLIEMGPPQESSTTVGSGGGYGGIYCFALTP